MFIACEIVPHCSEIHCVDVFRDIDDEFVVDRILQPKSVH